MELYLSIKESLLNDEFKKKSSGIGERLLGGDYAAKKAGEILRKYKILQSGTWGRKEIIELKSFPF